MVNRKMKVKLSYLGNVILLDTGSKLTETIINPNLVTDIRTIKNPVVMKNNAETKLLTLEAIVKVLGHAW